MKSMTETLVKADSAGGRSAKELGLAASRARNAQDFKRAAALYRTLCDVEPREPRHPHQVAELCMRLGYYHDAMDYLRQAVGLYVEAGFLARAIAAARLALTIDKADVEMREQLGDLLTIKENERWLADAQLAPRPTPFLLTPVLLRDERPAMRSVPAMEPRFESLAPAEWMDAQRRIDAVA